MDVDTLLDLLQWPAMAVTLVAAFLVGARHARKRVFGFWTFILSNVLWIVWGVHDEAWALIALQAGLAAMNVRAIFRNERGDPADEQVAEERRTT
ncbi:hypothetical protein [Massilia sp.]|uniref:hypothetical protein n=1 Tax=Massilia sp. TaxID=1882437 RepID=UPI00352C8477